MSAHAGQAPAPQPATDLALCCSQKHVDQGQFPEFMPKDTIMQQHDWCVTIPRRLCSLAALRCVPEAKANMTECLRTASRV